jgi:hypothetical protein
MEIAVAAAAAQGQAMFDKMKGSLDRQKAAWKKHWDEQEEGAKRAAAATKEWQELVEAGNKKAEEAERERHEAAMAHIQDLRDVAASLMELGDIGGGAFGGLMTLGAGFVAVLANLKLRTEENISSLQKMAGAIQGAASAYKSGSVLGGAASGASAGAMFGPIGAGIGAVVGGLFGFLGSKKKKQEEEQRKAIEAQNKALEDQRKRIEALTTAMGGLDLMAKGVTASSQDGFDRLGRYAVAAFSAFIKQTGDISSGRSRSSGPVSIR